MASSLIRTESSAPPLPIDPSDWSYLAEGGFHVILRYDGLDPRLRGRILRIGKRSLVHEHTSAKDDEEAASAPDEAGERRKFEHGVLVPLLGSAYVQPGEAVTLTEDDIRRIHESIDRLRPEGRMSKDAGHWSCAAQLEPDKTAFWLELPNGYAHSKGHGEVIIAVEIKPKGAVMPVGTLIPPGNNRIKYRVWRFDAQQRFKAHGKQSWGTIDTPCLYHPKEFYSGDAGRAAATLKELMKTPQNKLRAWENGRMLFGAGSSGEGDHKVDLDKAVNRAGLAHTDRQEAEALMDLIGELLAREPLVSKLVAAQALDVLEVEGGGLVFDRLVALCGGSKDDALDMLERAEAEPFEVKPPHPDLLLPEATLSALRTNDPFPEETEGIDAFHKRGLAVVEKLSVEDCVQLLRRYIIALGVMDCSIMMSLQAVELKGGAAPGPCTQGDDVAGVLSLGDGRQVAYCVSVVDAGPKPPTKLPGKAKHEHKIWDFVADLEAQGEKI